MGNQHSATEGDQRRPFARTSGALGLTRTELDKRCQPSGLYEACQWEERAIRKIIGDGKVAARLKGDEFRTKDSDHECPICFLYYSEINVTKCCNANLCTECYLQVRPQKEKHATCPFCNNNRLNVSVARKLSADQIQEREKDEQLIIEARIRRDNEEEKAQQAKYNKIPGADGFGSSLEQDSRVALMRKRSESFASSDRSDENQFISDDAFIKSLAMTPEERRRLEEEMKAQHSHPVALRLEAEAQERRLQNERAYYRSHSGPTRDMRSQRAAELFRHTSARRRARGPGGRDWNQIVDAFERGGNGEVNSLDDLVILEAAILLSMEEEARRSRNGNDDESFDAARHALDGFPLVRSFLANRGQDDEPATQQQVQSLARSLSSSRRRNQLLRSGHALSARAMPESALDTAALLMRGISEEEQLAMAIAASLQDQNNAEDSTEQDGEDESGDELADSSSELELENGERAAIGIILDDDDDGVAPSAATSERNVSGNRPTADQGVIQGEIANTESSFETSDAEISETRQGRVVPGLREHTSQDAQGDGVPMGQLSLQSSESSEPLDEVARTLSMHSQGETSIVESIPIEEPQQQEEDVIRSPFSS